MTIILYTNMSGCSTPVIKYFIPLCTQSAAFKMNSMSPAPGLCDWLLFKMNSVKKASPALGRCLALGEQSCWYCQQTELESFMMTNRIL